MIRLIDFLAAFFGLLFFVASIAHCYHYWPV